MTDAILVAVVNGELVRNTRIERKQSRKLVASLTGLTEAKIWNIEKGRAISGDEVDALAQWLGDDVPAEAPAVVPTPAPAPVDPPQLASTSEPTVVVEEPASTPPRDAGKTFAEALLDRTDVRLVSNSEIQAYKRCKRKWWLSWHRGLRFKGPDSPTGPRAVGDRGHRALAQWYVPDGTPRTNPRDALERLIVSDWSALVEAMGGSVDPQLEKNFTADANLERIIIAGYLEWLAETGEDADLRIIAPEQVLATLIPLNNTDRPVYLIGRLDARVQRVSDGAHQFVDHKFVGNFTQPVRVLHLNEQMLTYDFLERANRAEGAPPVAGALYSMLRRVKRTERATPPFYLRTFVGFNAVKRASFERRLGSTIHDMVDTARELDAGGSHLEYAYPTPDFSCAWQCPFFAICDMFDDGSHVEALIDQFYERGDPRDYYRRDIETTKTEEQ